MKITGENIGKKFGKTWIFKEQNFEFLSGQNAAITGKNGAGKSTMLQIISGYLTPSKGNLLVSNENVSRAIQSAYIGPYTEIIEEFTLREFLNFHKKFKKAMLSSEEMADLASLPLEKPIGDFSTGMKQRVKLITAFYFENDSIFMDEPTSNLDVDGFKWWKEELSMLENRLTIIASNDLNEIKCCSKQLNL